MCRAEKRRADWLHGGYDHDCSVLALGRDGNYAVYGERYADLGTMIESGSGDVYHASMNGGVCHGNRIDDAASASAHLRVPFLLQYRLLQLRRDILDLLAAMRSNQPTQFGEAADLKSSLAVPLFVGWYGERSAVLILFGASLILAEVMFYNLL